MCWHGIPSQPLVRCKKADNRSNSAPPAAIITGPALSELCGLRLYANTTLLNMAHEKYGADSTVEYA